MNITEILLGLLLVSTASVMLLSTVVMFSLMWEDLKDVKSRKKKQKMVSSNEVTKYHN